MKGVRNLNGALNDQSSIYLQIARMIEDDILRGIYREEEQVPSTNELARVLCINPATAGKGVNLLVDEGILYKRRGLGMFVAPGAEQQVKQKRRDAFYAAYVRPMVREAAGLGLSERDLLEMVEQATREEENA